MVNLDSNDGYPPWLPVWLPVGYPLVTRGYPLCYPWSWQHPEVFPGGPAPSVILSQSLQTKNSLIIFF